MREGRDAWRVSFHLLRLVIPRVDVAHRLPVSVRLVNLCTTVVRVQIKMSFRPWIDYRTDSHWHGHWDSNDNASETTWMTECQVSDVVVMKSEKSSDTTDLSNWRTERTDRDKRERTVDLATNQRLRWMLWMNSVNVVHSWKDIWIHTLKNSTQITDDKS